VLVGDCLVGGIGIGIGIGVGEDVGSGEAGDFDDDLDFLIFLTR
jgi:hypothetical protein